MMSAVITWALLIRTAPVDSSTISAKESSMVVAPRGCRQFLGDLRVEWDNKHSKFLLTLKIYRYTR
jgi:hypothetical protein